MGDIGTLRPGSHVDLDGKCWVVDSIDVDDELGLVAVWLLRAPVFVDEDGNQTFLESRLELLDF